MVLLDKLEQNPVWQKARSSYIVVLTLLIMGFLSLMDGHETLHVLLQVLSDAYIAVSVFVAFTFAVFYTLEAGLKLDTKSLLKKYQHIQVPIAAVLGSLPGCGGAIIVVTQYVRGRISFGSVVAVLTATMGDAAFLLLAQAPKTGLLVMGLGIVVGSISGYIIDMIHGQNYLRPDKGEVEDAKALDENGLNPLRVNIFDGLWLLMIVPGFAFGLLSAFQVETVFNIPADVYETFLLYFGAFGGLLAGAMWVYASVFRVHTKGEIYGISHNIHISSEKDHPVHRVIQDTNFVTTWVVLAFFVFEMTVHVFAIDLAALFSGVHVFLPLIAILIGFIPGCGPQILVTATYLSGAIPLSAQLGNAISNDGDALFPAIALAPKAAVVATIYSGIPAFIVAYGYMWFFE